MSVDFRTRVDSVDELAPVDVRRFFTVELPEALTCHAMLLAPGIRHLAMTSFTFEVAGQLWTLIYNEGKVAVVEGGVTGAAHTRLSLEDFSGLVRDLYTPMTFLTGGDLDMVSGGLGDFLDCWLVLRGALDGRAIYTPGSIDFLDLEGKPLDLHRSFGLDDSLEEMSHFLHEAGFLHLVGLFSAAEMAEVSRDMDRAAVMYSDGDGNSWWAKTGDGTNRLVRMQGFDKQSPITARLMGDDRLLSLGNLTGDNHVHGGMRGNRIEALIKPLDVVKGISDLPWHKDCSLGRHSYDCCSITVGISVTGADANSGQLRVIAGSHRALLWTALIDSSKHDLPNIELPTQTGDVTVHLSCTLHMSQAPVDRERRVMYTGFRLPVKNAEAARESLARISAVRESAYTTISQ